MSPDPRSPTIAAMLGESFSLVCFMAIYGPPVLFLVVPWLFLGLILSGPFAFALTLVVALLTAAALVGGVATIVAAPYLLLRRYRSVTAPRVARGPVELRQVVA